VLDYTYLHIENGLDGAENYCSEYNRRLAGNISEEDEFIKD
jgi:hypothetical protein